jgi:hypothetical protein
MRRQTQTLICVLATILIGCGPRDNSSSQTGRAGSDTAGMPAAGTATDTSSMSGGGMRTDTGSRSSTGKMGASDSGKNKKMRHGRDSTRR